MSAANDPPGRAANASGGRVWGWDVLRGLCALAVAVYHLMHWQGLGTLSTFGSYGVYLFFVLSGASLAYTYDGRLAGASAKWVFLATRWLRLAPLFILVTLIYAAVYSLRMGEWLPEVGFRLALNVSFLFGLVDPVDWSLPIGGWSLGIEFVFYLLFPLLLWLAGGRAAALVAVLLAALQAWWIWHTAGSPAGYAATAVAYHQVPAFGGYFFVGVLIGLWQKRSAPALPLWAGLVGWASMAALLLRLNPVQPGDELLGLRGLVLASACIALVSLSGCVRVPRAGQPLATWLGDITYGTYLLHPVIFFGISWYLLPAAGLDSPDKWLQWQRWSLLAGVLIASSLAAWVSDRWLEQPVRRWGKRMLANRLQAMSPGSR